MRNRDYMRYLERLKRDMEILKNSSDISRLTRKINRLEHEIDIEHSTDSDEISTFPERLSREELFRKIQRKRHEVIDDIRRCWKLDNGLKRKWQSALLNIDLFHPDATNEIRRLRHQVEGYCNDLPPDYGYWDTSTYLLRDGLELTAFDMKRLEQICSDYQEKR